ncbi:MAG: hypothetical protein ACJ0QJ_05675 [Flavobacteriales bacterium]
MVRILMIAFFLCSTLSKGQDAIDGAIEYLQKLSIEENDWENTAVVLEEFLEHPLEINNLNFTRIQKFPLLNSRHFFVIKKYRKLNGTVFTSNELKVLPFFTPELIKIILPFITFESKQPTFKFQGRIMHKTSFNLEPSKGFTRLDSMNFLGGRTQETMRFKLSNYKHNFAFVWEKDKGEKVNDSFLKIGYQGNFNRYIKQVNVGAYSLCIGEGLIHSNNFIVGKNNPLNSFYKIQRSLKLNSSSTEYNYENGTAFIYKRKKIKILGFYSINKLQGTIENDTIRSLKQDGLFRTNSEIAYKNQSHYQLIGNSVHYEFHKTTIAFNTLKTSFSKPYQPFPNYYNTNYSMYKLWNNSINYRFFDGDKIVKGEVAMDQNGNLATTHFLVFKLTDAYNLMTNARFFSPKYNSFGANALSENSKVQNEKAVLFAGDYREGKTQIYASADFFSFPTPKYLVQLPSYGKEFMGYLNYQITDSLIFKLFFKQESKYKNQKSEFMNEPKRYTLSHVYGKIIIKANKGITITSRLDFSKHQTHGLNTFGRTSYLEISHKKELSSFSARMVFFKTDNWDTRIYLYEKDVLYHFSVPALYDEGTRFYINYNRALGKHIKIWLKYGRTVFENKSSISSGNNEIDGNLKTEIRGQVLIKF